MKIFGGQTIKALIDFRYKNDEYQKSGFSFLRGLNYSYRREAQQILRGGSDRTLSSYLVCEKWVSTKSLLTSWVWVCFLFCVWSKLQYVDKSLNGHSKLHISRV